VGQTRRRLLGSMALMLVAPAYSQQSQRVYRLGMLVLQRQPLLDDPFLAALEDRGWKVGRNLRVELRESANDQERAPDFARQLLAGGAEMLVVVSTGNAIAARKATSTVPIVMLGSGFPVESGLAETLARPGGNVTGLCVYAGVQLFGKYVGLFKEMLPTLRNLGVFWGYTPPAFPQVETDLAVGAMSDAAKTLGINVRVWMNRTRAELTANLVEADRANLDGLFVSAGGPQSVGETIKQISAFCSKRSLPAMSDVAGLFFRDGGVLAYSVNFNELGLRGAAYVDRILRGGKPAEMPIEQPTRFDLVVNLRRAKAIGFTVPPAILLRADRVIE